ncbi:MAG: DUF2585 family protein [Promethearchaeota archaeon]
MGFFARDKDDVAESAVDFFSIGHIMFGQFTFWIIYMLFTYAFPDVIYPVKFWALIITIIVGIAWEPIENIILWKMGLKFENKRDSWLNIIFDILFVILGGVLAYLIEIWWVNLILVIVELTVFLILKYVVFA